MEEQELEYNKEFGEELEVKNGYFTVPGEVASAILNHFRCRSGLNYLAGKVTYHQPVLPVFWGDICPNTDNGKSQEPDELSKLHERLASLLDEWKSMPLSYVKESYDNYSFREGNKAILYVRCAGIKESNAVMGIALNTDEGPKKTFLMAGALIYAFGRLNRKKDPVLYKACCEALPYEAGLGNPQELDKVIEMAMHNAYGNGFDESSPFQ